MQFTPHTTDPRLTEFVAAIFHYKNRLPEHSIERVVPNGHVYIIFELDGLTRHTYDNDSLKPIQDFTKVWVSGLQKNYISISAHPDSEMFVIQFKPLGAYPFFQQPMHHVQGKILPAEEVFGKEILLLQDRLKTEEDLQQKFALAEEWLLKRLNTSKQASEEFIQVLTALQQSAATDFPQVLASYPNSQKHLIDQFKKYIGLTPKSYQRILRFNEILQEIQQQHKISWAQIAYQCGYTDQSHFIKEFKYFSGFNPKDFIEMDFHQQEPNFFPLDRGEEERGESREN